MNDCIYQNITCKVFYSLNESCQCTSDLIASIKVITITILAIASLLFTFIYLNKKSEENKNGQ